jgi:selenocysteine lyase/cysteine desulfurase
MIPYTQNGNVDLEAFRVLIKSYDDRDLKIAAVTSASNVTGVYAPYYEISEIMHNHNGFCFVDFACSAPYVNINMHPENSLQSLDAIYFSPHKFLGGPGSSGILIFNKSLYKNRVPDSPGGGTVDWTNPWGEHKYIDDIQLREDGGTPGFLQTIKTALCIQLKEQMGVDNILQREDELHTIVWNRLSDLPNLHVLADNIPNRLGIYSFYIEDLHFNLGVQLLNDKFGIQVRGGCSCAGTYGHILLNVDIEQSNNITNTIDMGDLSLKPGWIRMSTHPTMTNKDVEFIVSAIEELAKNHQLWSVDYNYSKTSNEFVYKDKKFALDNKKRGDSWFTKDLI